MKTNGRGKNRKNGLLKRFWGNLKLLIKEVVINYLANWVDKGVDWLLRNWKTILVPIIGVLVGFIVDFYKTTFAISGSQIIFSICFVVIFVVVVLNAKNIRRWVMNRRDDYIEGEYFFWKRNGTSGVVGPFCKDCRIQVVPIQKMENTIDGMFGGKPTYIYGCINCGNEIELDIPIKKLKELVVANYLN